MLLVITSRESTARWARKPIEIGLPGLICLIVKAIVLGPDNVAEITDPAIAGEDPGFAVFSAITHSHSERIDVILEALAGALSMMDEETGSLLAEFTEAGLGNTEGRSIWRNLMATSTYPYVSQLRSQGREEGRAEARAHDIARLLDKRGIAMTPAERERVSSCRDGETLDAWFDRVLTVSEISEFFAS